MTSRFQQLDELVLHLKGLVLVRDVRARGAADAEELELYNAEIERVRNRLADLVRNGGRAAGRGIGRTSCRRAEPSRM